jgi:UDP-glucose 4-epimerase
MTAAFQVRRKEGSMHRVLITGGLGLIGSCLSRHLMQSGIETRIYDLHGTRSTQTYGDVLDFDLLRRRMNGCDGVVHLAAVSRVIWGEREPDLCWRTNVLGARNVLAAANEASAGQRPWVVFASSREAYGQPDRLPASEDSPLSPINVYGRSKVAAEEAIREARSTGLVTAVARLSNVFGSIHDHRDRVVPAFAHAAANGEKIRIDGPENTFDFTWLDDVCKGLAALCHVVAEGSRTLPPIHFVTGRGTTLAELAEIARAAGCRSTKIEFAAPRSFDVARFFGDPARARSLLGWQSETPVERGVQILVKAFAEAAKLSQVAAN